MREVLNIKNNVRGINTKENIEKALFYLLRHKQYDKIFVKDICIIAGINRSSFYSHYQDVNDLMIQTEGKLSKEIANIFDALPYTHDTFIRMFEHIKKYKDFYTAYLKQHESLMERSDFLSFNSRLKKSAFQIVDFNETELMYHMAFSAAGIKALCKMWISTGMKETPEQMAEIVFKEYNRK